MLAKTVRDAIVEVLRDLTKSEFKSFKSKLCDRAETHPETHLQPRVRQGDVEDKDVIDIAQLLIKLFKETEAGDVVVGVLKAIDCNEQAVELETFIKAKEGFSCETSGAAVRDASDSTRKSYMVGDKHFVDHHRTALIQRVSLLEPILDALMEKNVIREEGCADVKAEKTIQKRMRELYSGPLKGCGPKGKDIFYEILLEHESFLMEDLSKSS